MESKDKEIDTNLYSRQIGTFGMEMMGKLIKMNVMIQGLRGLGAETAKNLILAGPKSVDLYDPTIVTLDDLGSNFYCTEEHVGKVTRAQACLVKLQELNPYVTVNIVDSNSLESLNKYHAVVITEQVANIEKLIEMNEHCRSRNIGFILTQSLGAYGMAFVDFGKDFKCNDTNGEEPKTFNVVSITQDKEAILTVHEDKRHSFGDGDYVRLTEVGGMTQINETEPIKITTIDGFSFKLHLDSTSFDAYKSNGLVQNVKVPTAMPFKSLKEALDDPNGCHPDGMMINADLSKFGRASQLHLGYVAIQKFFQEAGRLPENTEADVARVHEHAKQSLTVLKEKDAMLEEMDADIIKHQAMFSRNAISPLAAFFGGIVAQEIVKMTGKYTPIQQFLHYDIFDTLPREAVNREPMNCRYDDQIRIYGREVQQKLNDANLFMVGAGALGCEYAKAFALMGIGCSEKGKVQVTDNDNIEVSNLNRQFLFRKNNVGHSKSVTACSIAKQMNPQLNVKAMQSLVAPDTEDIFNDKFWDSLDFIVNAVDNIKARLYVDSKCVWHELPLLESGTLGTKANSQMIVPHVTQCYGDSQDPPEEAIPMCTLRNFPNQIEHCIEWARAEFEKTFTDIPNDTQGFIDGPQKFVEQLKANTTSAGAKEQMTNLKKLIDLKSQADYKMCVKLAREYFDLVFDHSIRDLLGVFPIDHKNSEGQLFWSGPKRPPTPITFDSNDSLHISFVMSCANLFAFNLNIKQEHDAGVLAQLANSIQVAEYKQKKIKVLTPEEEKEQKENPLAKKEELAPDDEEAINAIFQSLTVSPLAVKKNDISPADFEKDDDSNFHIDFMNAAANLRARNYKIKECDRQKTKMIAGKITPAIATTTAMITGAVSAEIYKIVQGFKKIEDYKNLFINLAISLYVIQEPDEVKKIKSVEYDPIMMGPIVSIPENHTIYDKVVIKGPMTMEKVFEKVKADYGVTCTMTSTADIVLYNLYLPGNKHAPRLQKNPEELFREIKKTDFDAGKDYMVMDIGGENDEGSDIKMPLVKYWFR